MQSVANSIKLYHYFVIFIVILLFNQTNNPVMVVFLAFTIGFIIGVSNVSIEILILSPIQCDETYDKSQENNIASNMALFLSALGNFARAITNPDKTYPIGIAIPIFVNTIPCTTAAVATLILQRDESEISIKKRCLERCFCYCV